MLFDGIKISPENRRKIALYMDNPTLEHWNRICNINLTEEHQLWRVMMAHKVRFIESYINHKWMVFPDAITLARAIKKFIASQNRVNQDLDHWWPKPAA